MAPGVRASLLLAVVVLGVSACGTGGSNDATAPVADAGMIADAVSMAAAATDAQHPLCETATFEEVQAVVGGHIAKLDVIDEATLHSVDCIYLDPQDYFNGLTIRFVTTERLVASASQWRTAAEYFAEWGRGGEAVTGLAQGAAWVDASNGLLVYQGDHVLHVSASKADLTDTAVRARFVTLARHVVARLP